jgi:hypothetical protein
MLVELHQLVNAKNIHPEPEVRNAPKDQESSLQPYLLTWYITQTDLVSVVPFLLIVFSLDFRLYIQLHICNYIIFIECMLNCF